MQENVNKYNYGRCRICGRVGKLTYEHIPPRGANNSDRVKIINGNELLKTINGDCDPFDYSSLRYINEQKGMGMYSLCSSCNNLTGTLYGNDYIIFSNTFIKFILDNGLMNSDYRYINVSLEKVYISKIIRQVLSMFCSISPGLSRKYPSIRKLILDKDYVLKRQPKYRISMFVLKNYRIGWSGPVALLNFNSDIKTDIKLVSELDIFPFGFIFEYGRNGECENLDITEFLEYSYDSITDLMMRIPVRERNILFPMDYRSKNEIRNNDAE